MKTCTSHGALRNVARPLSTLFSVASLFLASHRTHAACATAPVENFSPRALIEAVTKANSNVQSVDDLICIIPESVRKNFVLVTKSRSLQQSSPDAPRVILFSTDKFPRTFLTFNGKPGHKGFDHIEMLHETGNSDVIQFTDFDFSHARPGLRGGQILTGPHATVSTGQLTVCLSCHANLNKPDLPARPLMDAIPFWPNLYDSSLKNASLIPTSEVKNFKDFLAGIDRFPRYGALPGLKVKIVRNDFKREESIDLNRLAFANAKLTAALADINRSRLVTLTMSTPDYPSYRFAALAALLDCPDFESFLPRTIAATHHNLEFVRPVLQTEVMRTSDIDHFIDEMILDSEGQKLDLVAERGRAGFYDIFSSLLGSSPLSRFEADIFLRSKQWNATTGVDKLRWLMEGRTVSVDMREWSIDAEKSNYRFTNGPGYFDLTNEDDPELDLWANRLIGADPELRAAISPKDLEFQFETGRAYRRACSKLKLLSLAALQKLREIPRSTIAVSTQNGRAIVYAKCSGCHGNGVQGAPAFKFHDGNQLKLQYHQLGRDLHEVITITKSQRMPKFDSLLQSEIESIRLYIESLEKD